MVWAAGAWTSTAVLGRWLADRLVRSSQGLSCDHWLEPEFGESPVGWVRGRGPAAVRAEVRPGCQRGRFRSRRHAEVATTDLRVDEPAQARDGSRINTADEDALEHSVGSSIFEFPNNGLVSKPTTPSATA
jgi:hypothetical protein